MAGNGDVSVSFSVDKSSESTIRSQLNAMMANINAKPYKIKVELDNTKGMQSQLGVQLRKQLKGIQKSQKLSVQVSEIKIGSGAMSGFKKQLQSVVNTLNLDKGMSLTLTSKDIGKISKSMDGVSAANEKAAASAAKYKAEMKGLESLAKNVERTISQAFSGKTGVKDSNSFSEMSRQYRQLLTNIAALTPESATSEKIASIEREGALIMQNVANRQKEEQATREAAKAAADKAKQDEKAAQAVAKAAQKEKEATAAAADKRAAQVAAKTQKADVELKLEPIKNIQSQLKSALKGFQINGIDSTLSGELDNLTKKYRALTNEINDVRISGAFKSDGQLAKMEQEAREAAAALNKLQAAQKAASTETFNETPLVAGMKEYDAAIKKVEQDIQKARKALEQFTAAGKGKSSAQYNGLSEGLKDMLDVEEKLKSGKMTRGDFSGSYSKVSGTINGTIASIKEADEAHRTFIERFGGLASKFTVWLSASQIMMSLYNGLRQMVSAVVDVDTAMTELKKVTDETNATYDKFLTNAVTRSKTIGASLSDTVNATADFARLGYSINEASQMADAAITFKNVGDGIDSISQASEDVISTMQAFGYQASDVMSIVDKYNEVGNRFAISSTGVGEALKRSAAALAAGNNSLDQSVGLIAAANTIIQDP